MGALDFNFKKVHPFAERPVNINVLRSTAPKLVRMPASRYDCHIYTQYIKKRNTYIFADNFSNFKDVHFKLSGSID